MAEVRSDAQINSSFRDTPNKVESQSDDASNRSKSDYSPNSSKDQEQTDLDEVSNKETVPNDEVYNASLNSSVQQSIKEVDNTLEEKKAI